MIAFEYLEIRPCIHMDGGYDSFLSEEEFKAECARLKADDASFTTVWALYGRYTDEAGQFLAMAIGDFTEKDDAFTVMNALLSPMAKARDLLDIGGPHWQGRGGFSTQMADASNVLTDFIAQSSDRERL